MVYRMDWYASRMLNLGSLILSIPIYYTSRIKPIIYLFYPILPSTALWMLLLTYRWSIPKSKKSVFLAKAMSFHGSLVELCYKTKLPYVFFYFPNPSPYIEGTRKP